MKLNKGNKGFTLIELMIVVAIIGILAAVAIPKFADLVTKSKEASVKGSLGSLRSALSIYYGDTEGSYPTSQMWTALTTGNKYMPAAGGVASLGRYAIPAQSDSTPANTGHTSGFFANASGDGAVLYSATAAAVEGAQCLTAGDNTSTHFGEVYINCTHMDTKSAQWTSY